MKPYKLNEDYIVQFDDGKVTIFDPENSQLYTLNQTASFILNCIEKKFTFKKIVNSLVEEYNVKSSDAELEVQGIIDYLYTEHILK